MAVCGPHCRYLVAVGFGVSRILVSGQPGDTIGDDVIKICQRPNRTQPRPRASASCTTCSAGSRVKNPFPTPAKRRFGLVSGDPIQGNGLFDRVNRQRDQPFLPGHTQQQQIRRNRIPQQTDRHLAGVQQGGLIRGHDGGRRSVISAVGSCSSVLRVKPPVGISFRLAIT